MVLVTAEYGIETLKIVYSSLNHKPGYIITNAYTPVSLTRFLASSPHHKVSYDFETGEIREKEPVEIKDSSSLDEKLLTMLNDGITPINYDKAELLSQEFASKNLMYAIGAQLHIISFIDNSKTRQLKDSIGQLYYEGSRKEYVRMYIRALELADKLLDPDGVIRRYKLESKPDG